MKKREKHNSGIRYIILVMWIAGHSQAAISNLIGMRRKQVAGIIDGYDCARRSTMTNTERRSTLDVLLSEKPDGVDSAIYDTLKQMTATLLPVTGRKRRAE